MENFRACVACSGQCCQPSTFTAVSPATDTWEGVTGGTRGDEGSGLEQR